MEKLVKKGSNLTLPIFTGAKQYGSLKPLRAAQPLIPYNGAFLNSYYYNIDKLEDAKSWFAFDDSKDLFLTSFPKCGHHFTLKICLEIIKANNNGIYAHESHKTGDLGHNSSPMLEYFISVSTKQEIEEYLELTHNMYPRMWWTHYTFGDFPIKEISTKQKIITMIRNPKDCIISANSYYNYILHQLDEYDSEKQTNHTVDDTISYFLRGV